MMQRFWDRVAMGGPDECWEWQGTRTRNGYGQIGINGKIIYTHRLAYTLSVGDPAGLIVCHHCDNPPCCNPAHLYGGTRAMNSHDMVVRGRCRSRGLPGDTNGAAKLKESDVIDIRKQAADGVPQRTIAAQYGVHQSMVYLIAKRKKWQHIP
jgi:hypothetical protein